MKVLRFTFLSVTIFLLTFAITLAQDTTGSKDFTKQFKETMQRKYFSLNLGVQVRNQLFIPEENKSFNFQGFALHRIRTRLSGQLNDNISYLYQIDYVNTVKLMDASVSYKFSPELIVDIGQFKSGYSREWLLPYGRLNFSDRARIVDLFSPKRQIGIQFKGEFPSFTYQFGFYNGNGTNVSPDSRASMFTGRITFKPLTQTTDQPINVDVGLNGAYSDDSDDKFAKINNLNNLSRRIIAGVDINVKYDWLTLTGEYHRGWIRHKTNELQPWGAFIDLNFETSKKLNVILRGDLLKQIADLDLSTVGQIGIIYKTSEISLIRISIFKDLNKSKNTSIDRAEIHFQFYI